MSDPLKKRIGHPRELARSVLSEYFFKQPPFKLPIPIKEVVEYYGFEVYEISSVNKNQRALKI
jgi:hypothetical protein